MSSELSRRTATGCRIGRGRAALTSLLAAVLVAGVARSGLAQTPASARVMVAIEGDLVTQSRNDIRIPPVGGSEFSIVDLIGRAPTPSIRAEFTVRVSERQDLRLTYAPLRITGRGAPARPIQFAGGDFGVLPTDAEFKFNSYRATWRYRVHAGDTWTWRVGVTAFVRDARIALAQPGESAEDTDVGFVPLGHVSGEARLATRWSFALDGDGSAAPQGRALDVSALLNYRPSPRISISGGYRLIEGGADVDRVYTFAWLNAAVARVAVGF